MFEVFDVDFTEKIRQMFLRRVLDLFSLRVSAGFIVQSKYHALSSMTFML